MQEIKSDLKEIKKEIQHVHVVMARNTASLEIHVKRTDAAEDRITKLEYWTLGLLGSIVVAVIIKAFTL